MKTYDLLVLPPQDKPIYFVVEREYGEEYAHDHWKFVYESHSCPTNWLEPIYMVHDGNSDPHGLIRYIGSKTSAEIPDAQVCSPSDHEFSLDGWIESTNGVIPDPID